MTKSQKRVFSKLKKELKKYDYDKQTFDTIYSFIKKVEKLIMQEEQEYKQHKKEKEREQQQYEQQCMNEYLQYNINKEGEESWEEKKQEN